MFELFGFCSPSGPMRVEEKGREDPKGEERKLGLAFPS